MITAMVLAALLTSTPTANEVAVRGAARDVTAYWLRSAACADYLTASEIQDARDVAEVVFTPELLEQAGKPQLLTELWDEGRTYAPALTDRQVCRDQVQRQRTVALDRLNWIALGRTSR